MGFIRFLLTLHGELRWIVALLAVVLLVVNTLGLVQKRPYSKLNRQLMIGYAMTLALNFLIGLILLFSLGGGFPTNRIEHAVTMLIAVGVASRASKWAKSNDYAMIYRNNLIVVLVSILLIAVGVIRLRGGWIF